MPLDFVPATTDAPVSTPSMGNTVSLQKETKSEAERPAADWVQANPDAALAYVFAAQEDDGVIQEVLAL
ncbi:MAG: hypothetical protein DHS20C05_04910 [Hyphococcus sp.]|nr:MAG: hypothetical protein DHS20C05_04910 [Marinicaulis sp.]